MTSPSDGFQDGYALEFRATTYRLPSGAALISDLNLRIAGGETLVLLGRSGSGKTTTLKLINRLLEPTEGEILIAGRPSGSWDPIQLRRGIGYVIQDAGLFPHWTVERNVALVPTLEQWPEDRIRARVREMLVLVGLPPEEFAERRPSELSGGQRQRVGVARALAADPPILLMDEPFGALDPITRADLQREFRALGAAAAEDNCIRHARCAGGALPGHADRLARSRASGWGVRPSRISEGNRAGGSRFRRVAGLRWRA